MFVAAIYYAVLAVFSLVCAQWSEP